MTTALNPDHTTTDDPRAAHRFRPGWLATWALLTASVAFEVAKHGYGHSAGRAAAFTAVAVMAFVAPDVTMLIGATDPTAPGHLSPRAVPAYNAVHRMWVPTTITVAVGLGLAPLTLGPLVAFVAGLSWMAHIALDRAGGYGLRNADGSR